jgi:hypothetical protein
VEGERLHGYMRREILRQRNAIAALNVAVNNMTDLRNQANQNGPHPTQPPPPPTLSHRLVCNFPWKGWPAIFKKINKYINSMKTQRKKTKKKCQSFFDKTNPKTHKHEFQNKRKPSK